LSKELKVRRPKEVSSEDWKELTKPFKKSHDDLKKYLSAFAEADTLKEGVEQLNRLRGPVNKMLDMVIDYRKEFGFVRNPLLKAACISYAKKSRQAVVDREYTKSRLIEIIDLFKTQYARLAALLTKDGLLPEADLIYFLTHGEIGRLIQGESSLAPLAARRKKAFALQEELSFDDTYMGKPVADVYDLAQDDGALSGVPVSNGKCEGRVRIVHSAEDANRLQKGEIMVARFTDIGWTPYYSVVSGLITEIGSSLSHGAVVAREYGLPTIVNVKGATQVLKDGDHILMDAEKGLITRM
jgi:pyruvate,water dikinase